MSTRKNDKTPAGGGGLDKSNYPNRDICNHDSQNPAHCQKSPTEQLQIFEHRMTTADSESAWVDAFMGWLDVHPIVFGYADRITKR